MAGMRMLRHDEYIQMAGRAGRRGKDDKGIVIYLPDREPVEPSEMKAMMKGTKPPIISRMDFHYDFILKTIQSSDPNRPLKWLQIMEQSYWFQQRQKQITKIRQQLLLCDNKMKTLSLEEKTLAECKKRADLEQKIKLATNASRKEIQRELDSMKNRQFGPKWLQAWSDYSTLQILTREKEVLEQDLATLEDHKDSIHPSVSFLHHNGYLLQDNPLSLQHSDLTLKGILATEVNEGHQILMTELYTRGLAHHLNGNDLVTILACFQEDKETEESPSIHKIDIPDEVRSVLLSIHKIAMEFQKKEEEMGYPIPDYWSISTRMIEPMRRWIQGENASIICFDHDIFEGNFIRTVMKMGNMLDEWLSMATYCQHTEQIEKIMEVRQRMIRDIVISDSLYLHL